MVHPVTAQDEILKRIRFLDREEDNLRRTARNLLAEAGRAEAEAEAKATMRRQYEFALKQLGGELPKDAPAPVRATAGRLVGQLG